MGTMDGANVEIHECVGDENIFIFGLRTEEVNEIRAKGYNPTYYYNTNPDIKRIIDTMREGIGGESFREIADSLLFGRVPDPYMVLADFADYKEAQTKLDLAYRDRDRWNRMSLVNIARAGFFASDRSVEEYCDKIWDMKPVRDE